MQSKCEPFFLSGSRHRQDPRPQQSEVSVPIHLALEHLQTIDLPLRLTVGSDGRDRVANCPQILTQTLGKLTHFRTIALAGTLQPGV